MVQVSIFVCFSIGKARTMFYNVYKHFHLTNIALARIRDVHNSDNVFVFGVHSVLHEFVKNFGDTTLPRTADCCFHKYAAGCG